MNVPLVSIIIPNYNHAKYLDERILSCLYQTFQDFEVILLDDNSTDNSKNIIEKYRNNPKVSHIIYNENNSGSTFIQWNKGFELAKGEYIWLAESDDFCETNLLQELVTNIIQDENNVIAFCQSQFVNSKGEIIPPFLKKSKNRKYNGFDFIKKYMLSGNIICNASSAIFKKQTLLNVSKSYMNYKGGGDRLFWIEIAKQGNVNVINKPLNYFRQHENKVSPTKIYDGTIFYEAHKTYIYLKDNGYISIGEDFFVKNHYINQIKHTVFKSKQIKSDLLRLWNNNRFINQRLNYIIDKLYLLSKNNK